MLQSVPEAWLHSLCIQLVNETCPFNCLHIFKLIYTTLGIAFTDFTQGLVLVTTLAYILPVNLVHCCLLCFITRLGQVLLQSLNFKHK